MAFTRWGAIRQNPRDGRSAKSDVSRLWKSGYLVISTSQETVGGWLGCNETFTKKRERGQHPRRKGTIIREHPKRGTLVDARDGKPLFGFRGGFGKQRGGAGSRFGGQGRRGAV